MTARCWLRNTDGDHAAVDSADERARVAAAGGWTAADEPDDHGFVLALHEGVEQPGRFPYGIWREVWQVKGWQLYSPAVPEQAAPAPEKAAKAAAKQTAVGGDGKE